MSDIARMRRETVTVDPDSTYREIGLRSFGKGVFHKEPVSGASLGTKRVFRIHPGDLLLSNVFAWEGAIAVASEAEAGLIGSHRFMTYVVDPSEASASYLRHFFLSEDGLELIRRASPGSAGRNRTLGIDAFEAIEIALPAVEEQRRVADVLDQLTERAEVLNARASYAEKVVSALPASLAQRPDLSDQQKVTRGWRRIHLADVMAPVKNEVRVEVGATYPNVGILSFGRGLFEKPPIDGSITSAQRLNRIKAGQFIYSRLFAFEGAYASVPSEFDGRYVSNEFPTFDVDNEQVVASFLAAYFRSPETWENLARSSHGLGVRRQRVRPEAVLAFEVWLPPRDTQHVIVDRIASLDQTSTLRDRAVTLVGALCDSSVNTLMAPVARSATI
jgi:hypothetical protein